MPPTCDQSLSTQLNTLKERIHAACLAADRSVDSVKLIAVSKTKPVEAIEEALAAGQLFFGENKIQELSAKMEHFSHRSDIEWHMIGALQSNKIKYMAERVDWVHSIPKKKTLDELEKRAAVHERVVNALIQVNISDEDQKSGCSVEALPALLEHAQSLKNVHVRGLMGIATNTDDLEEVRQEFRLLKGLLDEHKDRFSGAVTLSELSMGMTNDLEVAIQEGSTMIRVGTAIFGHRNYG